MTRTIALALLAAALLSCEPPSNGMACYCTCDIVGGACVTADAPGIEVRADMSAWDDAVAAYQRRWYGGCWDCAAGDVERFGVLRAGEDALFVRMVTVGPPALDGSVVYAIRFSTPELDASDPAARPILVLLGVGAYYGAHAVSGLPIDWSFTPDGVIARIPIALLPYDDQAWVSVSTWAPDSVEAPSSYRLRDEAPFVGAACWSPRPGNRCSGSL